MSSCNASPSRDAQSKAAREKQRPNDEDCGRRGGSPCRGAFLSAKHRPSFLLMLALIVFMALLPMRAAADENTRPTSGTDALFDVDEIVVEHEVVKYDQAMPRVQELRSRKTRCPKKYRNFCMNNGKCRYEIDLQKPICRCKGAWVGERCDLQEIDIWQVGKFFEENSHIIIPCVITGFVFIVLLTAVCICWRRYRYIKRHKGEKDSEVNHNILSKGDSKSDEGSVVVLVGEKSQQDVTLLKH